jgi:hypothetical protein
MAQTDKHKYFYYIDLSYCPFHQLLPCGAWKVYIALQYMSFDIMLGYFHCSENPYLFELLI